MFKKLILAVLLALPMTALAQKLGTVEVEAVFTLMPETKEMQTKLEDASKQYETAFQGLTDEINKLYTEFQSIVNDTTVLDTIKERRMQDLQELDKKAQQFAQTAQAELQRQQAQLMQPIQEKVMNAIKTVGNENGFTMIFPEGVPAYVAADVQDVTALVKTKLGVKD